MPSPKSLISALHTHWDAMEALVPLGRDLPVFEIDQVQGVIARVYPGIAASERDEKLRQMVSSGLLEALPRGGLLELHPLVREFVRGLLKEHALGLSSVLRARLDGVSSTVSILQEGLQVSDLDKLRRGATQLSELFHEIHQQLEHDHHAIMDMAERAKASNANVPISRRYSEVLAAFDEYIAPMTEMMDPGPEGAFIRKLEHAEQVLDHAYEVLSAQGALYSLRIATRHAAYRAKELRRMGREVLAHCIDTLMPLREEFRQHNSLSSAISTLLGRVRKRGLRRVFAKHDLPLWRRDQPRRVAVGDEVKTLMAEALNFQPQTVAFPDEVKDTASLQIDRVDMPSLRAALESSGAVPDLLVWLRHYAADWSDSSLLRVYHELLFEDRAQVAIAEQPTTVDLHSIRISYTPHGIVHGEPQT